MRVRNGGKRGCLGKGGGVMALPSRCRAFLSNLAERVPLGNGGNRIYFFFLGDGGSG